MCLYLQPSIITATTYIFSFGVLGATFPKPTEVRVVKVKYSEVMYLDWKKREWEKRCCEWGYLHPNNISTMANIISLSVLGATLPKPTETRPVKQKYKAVL